MSFLKLKFEKNIVENTLYMQVNSSAVTILSFKSTMYQGNNSMKKAFCSNKCECELSFKNS